MSVAEGTLTDDFRSRLLDLYGRLFGWQEMVPLRRPDRLTMFVGANTYINVRERAEPMVCHGYEHFGVFVASADDLRRVWDELSNESETVHLEPLSTGDDGSGSLRFRYLLPMAVEVQYFAKP